MNLRSSWSLAIFTIALLLSSCVIQVNDVDVSRSSEPPDLNGVWQVLGNAHWNLEGQNATKGPATHVLGALGGIPASLNYVAGGAIPYREEALQRRNELRAEWHRWDPVVKCYMPGIPRQTYMPFPLHIVQSDSKVFIAYEFGSNSRLIHLDRPGTRGELPSWMGYSVGEWQGDSLVVKVTDQVADTWFDAAGNFHSEGLVVTERYTRQGPDHIEYEATIEDEAVFTRPWTIKMVLYRRQEPDAQLLEYKCVPFAEDAVYGHLRQGEDRNAPVLENLH